MQAVALAAGEIWPTPEAICIRNPNQFPFFHSSLVASAFQRQCLCQSVPFTPGDVHRSNAARAVIPIIGTSGTMGPQANLSLIKLS
jgi:hypothetical protein